MQKSIWQEIQISSMRIFSKTQGSTCFLAIYGYFAFQIFRGNTQSMLITKDARSLRWLSSANMPPRDQFGWSGIVDFLVLGGLMLYGLGFELIIIHNVNI